MKCKRTRPPLKGWTMDGKADETQLSFVTCIGIAPIAPHLPKNTIPIHRTGHTLRLGSLLSGMRLPLGVTLATWIYARFFQCNAEVLQEDSTKSSSKGSHTFKESIPKLSSRVDIVKRNRINKDHSHEIVFAVKQRNMEELTRILHDVSDPISSNYGKHMSMNEVIALTSNPESSRIITDYLELNGAVVTSQSLGGEYIVATAPINVWETMLNTEFFLFNMTHKNNEVEELVRTERYWIPNELDAHVTGLFNTVDMPIQLGSTHLISEPVIDQNQRNHLDAYDDNGFTSPRKIRAHYNMGASKGSNFSRQAIYAANDDFLSPNDVRLFQIDHGLKVQEPIIVNGYASDTGSYEGKGDSYESNLDVQYIMASSPGSPTLYWHSNEGMYLFFRTLLLTADVPLVVSVSYGIGEKFMPVFYRDEFSVWAIKMGVRGITVFVASGDDGANGPAARYGNTDKCGYDAPWPASNPYVTSVGATSGVDRKTEEIVCSSSTGGSITSGGGFSTHHPIPSWQAQHVANYFTAAAADGHTPTAGYALGRGSPDLTFAGSRYMIMIGGKYALVAGTSASSPALAGLFSNVNAARIAAGKSSLGWINPALYYHASSFVKDITTGHNMCVAAGTCCSQGFYATKGWDPASGLGSVDYAKLESTFLALGDVNSASFNPSILPTSKPSQTPTEKPTLKPTSTPTIRQTSPAPSNPLNVLTASPTRSPSSISPSSVSTVTLTASSSTSASAMSTVTPTVSPSISPSSIMTVTLTVSPSISPSAMPTVTPTRSPSAISTVTLTASPSSISTVTPTRSPSISPSAISTVTLTVSPSIDPSAISTVTPTRSPSISPSAISTVTPTASPSLISTVTRTRSPSIIPSSISTVSPLAISTVTPTRSPSISPSATLTVTPTVSPSAMPTTTPTRSPSISPLATPTVTPTVSPSTTSSATLTDTPIRSPSICPSAMSTVTLTRSPSSTSSAKPTTTLTRSPPISPSAKPITTLTRSPSISPSAMPVLLTVTQVVTGLTVDDVNDPMFVSDVKGAVASVLNLSIDDVSDIAIQTDGLKLRYRSLERQVGSDGSERINVCNSGGLETVRNRDHGRQLSEVIMQYTISTTYSRSEELKSMVHTAADSGLIISSLATRGVHITSITNVKIYENSPSSIPAQSPILETTQEGTTASTPISSSINIDSPEVIGGAAGCAVLLGLIAAATFLCIKKRRTKAMEKESAYLELTRA